MQRGSINRAGCFSIFHWFLAHLVMSLCNHALFFQPAVVLVNDSSTDGMTSLHNFNDLARPHVSKHFLGRINLVERNNQIEKCSSPMDLNVSRAKWCNQYFDWVYSSKLPTSHNMISRP